MRYIELTQILKSHLGDEANAIFPPIEDVDVVDLIFYFNLYFEIASDYRTAVKTAMNMNGISVSDEKFEELFPVIESFLIFLRDMQ
jgi:hypothetical protein